MASNASAISLSIPEITEESNQETDGVWAKLTARFTNGEVVGMNYENLVRNFGDFHTFPTLFITSRIDSKRREIRPKQFKWKYEWI